MSWFTSILTGCIKMKKSLDDTKMKENCPSWVNLIMIYIKKEILDWMKY
jgi:hypothetical protein